MSPQTENWSEAETDLPSNKSLPPYVAQQDSQTVQGKEECLSSASRALKAQITLSACASRSCHFSCLRALGCSIRRCPAPSCSILCLGLPLLCEIGKSQFSSLCLLSPHCSEWILWRGLHSFSSPVLRKWPGPTTAPDFSSGRERGKA